MKLKIEKDEIQNIILNYISDKYGIKDYAYFQYFNELRYTFVLDSIEIQLLEPSSKVTNKKVDNDR